MVDFPAPFSQAHDGTPLQIQIDMVKHPVPPEGLAHTADREDDIAFCISHTRFLLLYRFAVSKIRDGESFISGWRIRSPLLTIDCPP